jgi:hypothetical protein
MFLYAECKNPASTPPQRWTAPSHAERRNHCDGACLDIAAQSKLQPAAPREWWEAASSSRLIVERAAPMPSLETPARKLQPLWANTPQSIRVDPNEVLISVQLPFQPFHVIF